MDGQTLINFASAITSFGTIYVVIRNFIKGVGWRKTVEFVFMWLLFTAIGIGAIGALALVINIVAAIFRFASPFPTDGFPSWVLVAYTIIAIVAFILAQNALEEELKKNPPKP